MPQGRSGRMRISNYFVHSNSSFVFHIWLIVTLRMPSTGIMSKLAFLADADSNVLESSRSSKNLFEHHVIIWPVLQY